MDSLRDGNFTSSEIVNLLSVDKTGKGFGKPALTYIEEKNMERRLGVSLDSESNARPIIWGRTLEYRVFELLGLEYELISDISLRHPDIPFWVGSPDGKTKDAANDIKCPFTRKSFCQLVQPLYDGLTGMDAMNKIRETHKEGETYYQQIVSNAILLDKPFGELIVYMPYKSELKEIKEQAEGNSKAYFIWSSDEEELPYLPDGGYYQNLNFVRFEIPQEEKDFLTSKVIEAGKLLVSNPSILLAEHDTDLQTTIISKLKKI